MDIKSIIQKKKLKQWQIAEAAEISEFTLCRWLRRPELLTDLQRKRVDSAVEKMLEERGHNHES